MRVKIKHRGYCGINQNSNMFLYFPHGYHRYLCMAANGIVVFVHQPVENGLIPDGEYELPDADWDLNNPKWEALADRDEDTIWDME